MSEHGAGESPERPAPGDRPSAASQIAELWSEREASNAAAAPSRPTAARPSPESSAPERPGRGRAGLVAGLVAVALILGADVGVVIARTGSGLPSKAAFVAKADALCAPANGTVAAITKPTSYPDLATAAGTLVAATESELGALGQLKLPGGVDGIHAGAVLMAMTETKEAGRGLKDAAGGKDDAATAAATQRMRAAASDATTKARTFGFLACGAGMQPGVDAVAGGASGIVKTAFVAKADNLCRAGARSMDEIRLPRNDSDFGRFLGDYLTVAEGLVADLKALPVPPGDEATLADTMAVLETMNDKGKEARDAALEEDASRFLAVDEELAVLGTAADAKLDAYGLVTCGSNFGSR